MTPATRNRRVAIEGAGPVGLFQFFELGLLGIRAHVIESMPAAGGQCVELYPDKPIYDIPAIPVCNARMHAFAMGPTMFTVGCPPNTTGCPRR